MLNDVYCAADNKYRTTLLQLDLSSAFDTLDTSTLLRRLRFSLIVYLAQHLTGLARTWCVAHSQFALDRNIHWASFVSTAFHKDLCLDRCCSHCKSLHSRKSSARSGSTMHSLPTTRNYRSRSRTITLHQGYQNAFMQFNIGSISMVCQWTQIRPKPLLLANGWKA